MKKILLFVLCTAPVLAWAADNIKMVTYFPVPYMRYENLTISQENGKGGICTTGLLNQCTVVAGNEFNVKGSAQVDKDLNLRFPSTVADKRLDTKTLTVGSSTPAEKVYSKFAHSVNLGEVNPGTSGLFTLRVDSVPNGINDFKIETLTGGNTVSFPASTCPDGNISWRYLTIDGVAGVYLTCGGPVTPKCKATVSDVTVMTSTHTGAQRFVYDSEDSCDNDHQAEFTVSNMNDAPVNLCAKGSCTDYFNRDYYEHWDFDSSEYFYYLQGDRTGIYGGTDVDSHLVPTWEEGKQCDYEYYGAYGPEQNGAGLTRCSSEFEDGGYVYTHHHYSVIDVCNTLFGGDKRTATVETPCWDGVHDDGMYYDHWCVYKLICRSFAAEKKRVWTFQYEGID